MLKETRFLACHVLSGLGESDAQDLYASNDREAWARIASRGWREFQLLAAGLLQTKEPSDQHRVIARLFRENIVRHIVSFNWDDMIEQAYSEQFDEEIPVVAAQGPSSNHALWKMHGDVRIPDQRWVLPYEEGRVFDGLVSQLENEVLLALIIGYREQERVVSGKLISPLQSRGSIVRIGPSQPNNPPLSFSDDAAKALRKLDVGFTAAKEA